MKTNVKKFASIFLALAMLFSMCAVISASAAETQEAVGAGLSVSVRSNFCESSSSATISTGNTITVTFTSPVELDAVDIQWGLNYDKTKLQLTGVTAYTQMMTNPNATSYTMMGSVSNIDNPTEIAAGGTMFTFKFKALAEGETEVYLHVVDLMNRTDSGDKIIVENGVVKTVSGVTLTPTSEVVPGVVTQNLTVKGTSNLFKAATATFDAETNKVTVTYQLKSSVKVIDSEWKLTYDSSKLTLDSVVMPKVNAPTLSYGTGYVNGNFTDSDLVDFTSMSDFVVATFDVKGTGTATVNLNVVNLGVAKYSGSTANVAYLVSNGAVKDITSQSGFSGYTYDTNTLINEGGVLVGDVDLNGVVNINDATLLQRYLAEFTTLSTNQLRAADVNKDGKINVKDVTAIRRMLLN